MSQDGAVAKEHANSRPQQGQLIRDSSPLSEHV